MTQISSFIPATPRPLDLLLRRFSALPGMIRRHRQRSRFHADLERMLNENPHLIDDIGLTRRQAEAELAKRYWEA